jgi:hypothetical protein
VNGPGIFYFEFLSRPESLLLGLQLDGRDDIIFRDAGGTVVQWLMNGGSFFESGAMREQPRAYPVELPAAPL